MTTTRSAYYGTGMQQLTEDAVARYRAAKEQQIANLELLRQERLEQEQRQAESQLQQAQVQQQQASGNPFFDPQGAFADYLTQKGVKIEEFFGRTEDGKELFSPIQREREYVQPYLEHRWISENLPRLASMGLSGRDLERAKQDYMKTGRAMAMADHSDRQAEVGLVDKAGSWLNAAGRGAVGLADSASGLIKTVAGDNNVVSDYIDTGTKYAKDALAGMNQQEQQELVEYANKLMSNGDTSKLAKLLVDYPSLLADFTAEQLAPLGIFAKGVGLAGKGLKAVQGAKAGDAVQKGAGLASKIGGGHGTVMAYSGYQMGGGMAQELSEAGIDPSSSGGVMAVALAGLGGAAITRFTPATLEKHVMNNFLGRGLSENTAKVLSQQTLEKLKSGGLFKSPLRYGMGLSKNIAIGAAGEGAEEAMQSGLEGWARQMVNKDGTWRDLNTAPLTDADVEAITKRAAVGGLLGAAVGGPTRGASNTLNRFGDNAKAEKVRQNEQYWADAQNGKFTGPASKAEGFDLSTFDPDTLGKNERALYDLAMRRKAEIEEDTKAQEADKAITDELTTEFGEEHGATARGDYDNAKKAEAYKAEIDTIIDEIVKSGANGVPTDIAQAKAEIAAITDPSAKAMKLKEWADLVGNSDLSVRAGKVATSGVDGYTFGTDGSYSNNTSDAEVAMSTAIETALGGKISDLSTELENLRSNSTFAPYIDKYRKAVERGYTTTAKEIAEQFRKVIVKHNKDNPPPAKPKYSDTVGKSLLSNGAKIATIVQAMRGPTYWKNKGFEAYKTDPIAEVTDLLDRVSTAPLNVFKDNERTELITQLTALKTAWESDQDHSIQLSPDLIRALTQVK